MDVFSTASSAGEKDLSAREDEIKHAREELTEGWAAIKKEKALRGLSLTESVTADELEEAFSHIEHPTRGQFRAILQGYGMRRRIRTAMFAA